MVHEKNNFKYNIRKRIKSSNNLFPNNTSLHLLLLKVALE